MLEGLMSIYSVVQTPSGFGNLILYGLGEPSGFVEANTAQPISFFPQTLGWLLVSIMLLAYIVYRIFKGVKHHIDNRYRLLCIAKFPALESEHFENELYHIMSTARAIANSANPNHQAHLFGVAWLIDMDRQAPNEAGLHSEVGKQWMQVLTFERRKPICFIERQQLLACCEHWMLNHMNSQQVTLKAKRGGPHGV